MDGTISLGIYDQAGKLVRVLHQNAQLDDFAIGADALVTRWDGKDDATTKTRLLDDITRAVTWSVL